MAELSDTAKLLIARYQAWHEAQAPKEGIPTVHVDEVASRIAAFYEQVRGIIDWKEEHLMRRTAIARKLKLRLLDQHPSQADTKHIAESLVLELVRGGYFANDLIPESAIDRVRQTIDKYLALLAPQQNQIGGSGLQFYHALMDIAACEIEETLSPSIREMALMRAMFSRMEKSITLSAELLRRYQNQAENLRQYVYIAVQQALFKFDKPIISYHLLTFRFPHWERPSEEELHELAQQLPRMLERIDQDIAHPLTKKCYAVCEMHDTPYLLLGDILEHQKDSKEPTATLSDPAQLETMVRQAYQKRLSGLRAKITRAAIYSTLSIFITKVLSLIIIEIILAKLFMHSFSPLSLVADVAIPTLLMAFLVSTVRMPSPANVTLAVMETVKIVFSPHTENTYELKGSRKRNAAVRAVLALAYSAGAAVSFGAIVWIFSIFQFPISSIIINLIFIALILFAGTAVRQRAEELTIKEESEGMLGFISDVLFLPIADLGRWMSQKWRQYNVITAFFGALIDMPFSAFVEFVEGWRYFIKERKEELR